MSFLIGSKFATRLSGLRMTNWLSYRVHYTPATWFDSTAASGLLIRRATMQINVQSVHKMHGEIGKVSF